MNHKKFLEIWNLSKAFPGPLGKVPVVEGFNLTVAEGEIISLIGHSGCGKSTVLSIVAGLTGRDRRHRDHGRQGGHRAGHRSRRGVPGAVPVSLDDRARERGASASSRPCPRPRTAQRSEKAGYYLSRVGLGDALQQEARASCRPACASASAWPAPSRSRRACCCSTSRSACSTRSRAASCRTCCSQLWREDKKTLLLVTHDVDESVFLSDRVVMMTSGPARPRGRDHGRHACRGRVSATPCSTTRSFTSCASA